MNTSLDEKIYRKINEIPFGKVSTYGRISAAIGMKNGARSVGRLLSKTPKHIQVVWHRVVNHQGGVSPRGLGEEEVYQQLLLQEEGIKFTHRNKIINFHKHLHYFDQ